MNRLLACFILLILAWLPGCGGPATDPEEPVRAVVKAVNDFAVILETVEKESQNAGPAEVEKSLDKASDALDKLGEALADVKDRLKLSKLTKPERNAYNSSERQKELEKAAERVRNVVPKVEQVLNRKDLKAKNIQRFRDTWSRLRARAAELTKEIAKWSEEN